VKGPQHYIDHLKITLLVLLWCNSDVSFPILGYRYLNREKISWAIGGGAAAPAAPPLNTPMGVVRPVVPIYPNGPGKRPHS